MLVEVLLKFLVGVVDIKLLKPIHLGTDGRTLYVQIWIWFACMSALMSEIHIVVIKYMERI